MAWYNFVKRKQPSPGAMAYARADFRTTLDSRIGGATVPIQQRQIWQPPQYWQSLTVPVDGIGGVTQGQLVGQPLFNLDTEGVNTTTVF